MKQIMTSILLLLVLSYSVASRASLETRIAIRQTPTQLHFHIHLQNTESSGLQLALTNQALNVTNKGLDSAGKIDGQWSFTIKGNVEGELDYDIPARDPSALFVRPEDLWTPAVVNPNTTLNQTFFVTAQLQQGFQLISSQTGKNQSEVGFVLCRCQKFNSADKRINVYLQNPEPTLAQSVLNALQTAMQKYETEIGPYPYDQFSVVESPQEIGLAFPKMTWIGSQLLHFPFILKTSLPHELLHSWWGNSVFVDYAKGNWCEGLTTLGADYGLLEDSEQKLYRLKAITDYLDYSQKSNEIPLSQFLTRGEDRSLQAIGYDKALMVLLMAKDRVGAAVFQKALKEFYRKFRFQKASYQDLFAILEQLSGKSFASFQKFWIQATGLLPEVIAQGVFAADSLQINWNASVQALGHLPGMTLPVTVVFPDSHTLPLALPVQEDGSALKFATTFVKEKPKAYRFDPDFHLFRSLVDAEKPVLFSRLFGSTDLNLLSTNKEFQDAAAAVFPKAQIHKIASVDFEQKQIVLISDDQLAGNPELQSALLKKQIAIQGSQWTFGDQVFSRTDNALFVATQVGQATVVLAAFGTKQTVLRWMQRWTHYGSKSYVVLTDTAAALQGLWLEPFDRPF